MKTNKKKLVFALLLALVGAGIISAYFWYQSANYVSTIDARISATMANVTPASSGKLVAFGGYEGQVVNQDQRLGTVESGSIISSLIAPFPGTLVRVNVEEGQTVSVGQTVAVVANMEHIFISANIEETDIEKVSVGQGVEIRIDSYPGKVFLGRISTISDASTSVFSTIPSSSSNGNYTKITQLIPIEVEFDNSYDENFKLGMNAEIKIHLKPMEELQTVAGQMEANSQNEEYAISGVLSAGESYSIKASVAGTISEVSVHNGDHVKSGDVLLKQNPKDALLQAGNGSTTDEMMQRLKIAYDTAQDTYEKNQKLFLEGAISETVYQQSLAQRDNAKLQYQGVAKSIAEITAKTVIASPADGTITELSVKVGDQAGINTPLVNVVNLSNLQLKASVPEKWLSRLEQGMAVELTIDSIGKTVQGELTYISPVSVASGQMFPIEITIDNSLGDLKAGMACTVTLFE